MAKPKKTPRKEGSGRKQLPYEKRKSGYKLYLMNEQWDEIFKETSKEHLAESFYQWFKESRLSVYIEVKDLVTAKPND